MVVCSEDEMMIDEEGIIFSKRVGRTLAATLGGGDVPLTPPYVTQTKLKCLALDLI